MKDISRRKLLQIYDLYTLWAEDFTFACKKGCSTCCTRSVSLTTLEAELILEYVKAEKPELLARTATMSPTNLNQPTTNEFAAACLRCEEMKNEDDNWDMRPCLFLEDSCCTIYPVRPFMCRSMGSKVPCHRTGTAEMEPLFLTLNTVIMQQIEHLDQGRPWGNMHTVLRMAVCPSDTAWEARHRISLPIPGLLIPPEEEPRLRIHLHTLQQIISAVQVKPSAG